MSGGRLFVDGRVSIVMAVWNGAKFIEKSLQALVDQTYEDLELIVVDDGSTDGSMDIASRILEDSGRKYYTTWTNGPSHYGPMGITYPVTVGWGLTTGEFITCHSCDNYSHPDRIQLLVDNIGDAPLAYSRTRRMHMNGEIGSDWMSNDDINDHIITWAMSGFMPGQRMILEASIFRKALFYKEELYVLMEDMEMCIQLALRRYGKFVYVHDSVLDFLNDNPNSLSEKTVLQTEAIFRENGHERGDCVYPDGKYSIRRLSPDSREFYLAKIRHHINKGGKL